jgi:mRNA interferase RelE/StbE
VSYAIEILRSAQKQLGKVDLQDRARIVAAVRSLSGNPRPHGCIKLSGRPAWRIRIGTYRVIYEIHDQQLVVVVVNIGHRKDAYQ